MFDAFLLDRSHETSEEAGPFELPRDYVDYVDGKLRSDGVRSFLASRGIALPEGSADDPPTAQTVNGLANRKNALLLELLQRQGVDVYEGRSASSRPRARRGCGGQSSRRARTAGRCSPPRASRTSSRCGSTGSSPGSGGCAGSRRSGNDILLDHHGRDILVDGGGVDALDTLDRRGGDLMNGGPAPDRCLGEVRDTRHPRRVCRRRRDLPPILAPLQGRQLPVRRVAGR